ncbi:TetR/AcrR family transcriptional regulator [Castellaniella sp. WN]
MSPKLSSEALTARRARILDAARWCFLNFGFSRSSLGDIAQRAGISRTLLYRSFKDKEDLFMQVFDDWMLSRLPLAMDVVRAPGSPRERLFGVCRRVLLEPWFEMEAAPMSGEFLEVCQGLSPEVAGQHRACLLECLNRVFDDIEVALVFMLALEGQIKDRPRLEVLERRVLILVDRFAADGE